MFAAELDACLAKKITAVHTTSNDPGRGGRVDRIIVCVHNSGRLEPIMSNYVRFELLGLFMACRGQFSGYRHFQFFVSVNLTPDAARAAAEAVF